MDVGVAALVVGDHRLDDGRRLLGGRRVVEVDQRLATDGTRQDREIGPQVGQVGHQPTGARKAS